MNRNQLVKIFISYLINTQKVNNQEEFGAIIGYPNKTVFSRKLSSNLDDDFIKKVQTCFPEYDKWSYYMSLVNSEDSGPAQMTEELHLGADEGSIDDKIKEMAIKIENQEKKYLESFEELSNKLRIEQLINRSYLRSIIRHLKIKPDDIKSAEEFEKKIKQ